MKNIDSIFFQPVRKLYLKPQLKTGKGFFQNYRSEVIRQSKVKWDGFVGVKEVLVLFIDRGKSMEQP